MSDFKHKAGSGTMFPNKYKEKENQPDHKGTMTDLAGKEWELAGWSGTTQAGDPKISIKVSEVYVPPKKEGANILSK